MTQRPCAWAQIFPGGKDARFQPKGSVAPCFRGGRRGRIAAGSRLRRAERTCRGSLGPVARGHRRVLLLGALLAGGEVAQVGAADSGHRRVDRCIARRCRPLRARARIFAVVVAAVAQDRGAGVARGDAVVVPGRTLVKPGVAGQEDCLRLCSSPSGQAVEEGDASRRTTWRPGGQATGRSTTRSTRR